MERFSRENTVADETSVRDRMRARAREQSRDERGPFMTPEWLDHSFVLPSPRVARAEPEQQQVRPPAPVFERPTTPEVDFAAMVRRADTGRRARLTTAAALAVAVIAILVFQVSGQVVAAGLAILAAIVTLGAAGVRIALGRAPVPYLET